MEAVKIGHLCISRRAGESFVIADDVVVTVCGFDRGKVKLLIEAPTDVSVLRSEIVRERGESCST